MTVAGGPKIPPQALNLERQTSRSPARSPLARRIVSAVLGVAVFVVVAGWIWLLVG